MKIAIFSDCYLDLTGGIITSINAQKAALEKLGHTIYIFSSGYPRTEKELTKLATKNIFQVPSCKLFLRGITPISRRPKIVERWLIKMHPELKDFDVFYVHYEASCSIAGLRLGKKLKIPTVQVMHGREDMGEDSLIPFGFKTIVATILNFAHSCCLPHSVKVKKDNYLADRIAKAKMWTLMVNHANYADTVISPSHHFAKKLKHYGVKKTIHVLPNGYLDDLFPQDLPLKELKPGEVLNLIWHSRVSGEKRIMPFLQALRLLQKKLAPSSKQNHAFILDVYGGGPDLNRAKRFAAHNHLNVKFHGNTPFRKFQSALSSAHLDILVSFNYDDYPLTLVEAEAYGIPVFICDPDMQEIIPKGSFVLSQNETPDKMATALHELINDPARIRTMSEVMLEHRNEILISHRIKPLENLFHSLVKRR